jgi:hypothetical protein
MTIIITRLFKDEASARKAASKLTFKGFPGRAVRVVAGANEASARLERAGIHTSALPAYAEGLKAGNAGLAIHATYKPLGAARIAREFLAKCDTVDTGDVTSEYYAPDVKDPAPSVLKEHPRFLTVAPGRTDYSGGPVTAGLGFGLLSKRRQRHSVKRGGGFMSRSFWPTPLLSKKPRKKSVISGGRTMSAAFWPTPLLSKRPRSNSVIRGGDLPFSRTLGWPPLI